MIRTNSLNDLSNRYVQLLEIVRINNCESTMPRAERKEVQSKRERISAPANLCPLKREMATNISKSNITRNK